VSSAPASLRGGARRQCGRDVYNYTMLGESEAQYFDIIPADQLPVGERLFVELEGNSVVVFNIAGVLFALADVCSHDDGPVGEGDLEGFAITCPRHGAQFDVRSGKVLQMPAVVDIPAYPIRVISGTIQLGVPKR
jgi:3-phenylpropionate/trans-cinnamate dioxygenase ferredoxin component